MARINHDPFLQKYKDTTGNDNHEAVVEVVNIEYFSEENVPLPVEKRKRIIGKCTDEDFDPSVK